MREKTIRKKFRCPYCDSAKVREEYDGPVKLTAIFDNGYIVYEATTWPKTAKYSKYYCENKKCGKEIPASKLWFC